MIVAKPIRQWPDCIVYEQRIGVRLPIEPVAKKT